SAAWFRPPRRDGVQVETACRMPRARGAGQDAQGRKTVNHPVYEYVGIGKGLLGAAAARHLSAAGQRVALIGPDEPSARASHQGIFGSHYDEGRITRILDPQRIWALLAQRSIARYREIEARSSVPFYHEVGHLAVGPEPTGAEDYVPRVQAVGTAL